MPKRKTKSLPSAARPDAELTFFRLAEFFQALADPTRLQVLAALRERPRCVHDLTEELGLQQSTLSHQLRILRDRALVKAKREGRHKYYELIDSHILDLLQAAGDHINHL